MSKRQALGSLAVNSNSQASRNGNGGKLGNGVGLKQPAKASNQFNNENQPPNLNKAVKQANEIDFEIFQEDRGNVRVPFGSVPTAMLQPRLREAKNVNFFLGNSNEIEDPEEEDEYDEPEKKSDYDEENVAVGSQVQSNKENEEENDENVALEEEGISRLNIAVMVDSTSVTSSQCDKSNQQKSELSLSHCELMMDSSSSTQNDDDDDRMLLDDTIKCVSMKSTTSSSIYIGDEYDEEEEEVDVCSDEDRRSDSETRDEEDEETRRRLASIERDNVMMNFAEYKDEILSYMRQLEQENRPKANYMKKQIDINSNMRSILIDWLVEVCEEYKLNVETLYLAVNYTDRFLSQMSVLRGKLQLVGTASMYIAAKYEEIVPPDISEFVYITDDTYTKKQVLRMEHLLLKVLDFKMSAPTVNWFLSYFLRFIKLNTSLNSASNNDLAQRIECLARYLAELTLIDSDTYLAFLPSQVAASAIYLSMFTLGRAWTRQTAEICGYSHDLSELKPCIQELFKTMQGALDHPQQAIQEKYKQKKYDYVALIEPPKSLPPNLC